MNTYLWTQKMKYLPLSLVQSILYICPKVLPKFLISQIRPFHSNTCIYDTYFDPRLALDKYYHFAANSFCWNQKLIMMKPRTKLSSGQVKTQNIVPVYRKRIRHNLDFFFCNNAIVRFYLKMTNNLQNIFHF